MTRTPAFKQGDRVFVRLEGVDDWGTVVGNPAYRGRSLPAAYAVAMDCGRLATVLETALLPAEPREVPRIRLVTIDGERVSA